MKVTKLQDYRNYFEAAQIEKEINHLQKHEIDINSLKEDQKEFLKSVN